MKCKDCKFYDNVYNDSGWCRAHPPVLSSQNTDFLWPEVDDKDWCGEYQQAEDRVLVGKDAEQA